MKKSRQFLFILILFLAACASPPDPSQPRAMSLNGKRYPNNLTNPGGYLSEVEAGFSLQYSVSIIFFRKEIGWEGRSGLEIVINDSAPALNQDLHFGAQYPDSRIYVTYTPAKGHKFSEGLLLGYSALAPDGGGVIRFQTFDPQLGGQIKGSLTTATLYGHYESAESMEFIELPEPQKLELWNFEFDVIVQEALF